MTTQLTDPAEICEAAVWHLGDDRGIEGTLGLAAFGSPRPFRDCGQCEPRAWVAFCRAKAVVEELGRRRIAKREDWWWTVMGRANDEREELLREAATWLREHAAPTDVDDEVKVLEYKPGRWKGIIKDPKLSYLGAFHMDTPEAAIADARRLLQHARDREAFEAGDDRFEEVNYRVCGVSYSEVHRKENA